jgi:hypothetical protein
MRLDWAPLRRNAGVVVLGAEFGAPIVPVAEAVAGQSEPWKGRVNDVLDPETAIAYVTGSIVKVTRPGSMSEAAPKLPLGENVV